MCGQYDTARQLLVVCGRSLGAIEPDGILSVYGRRESRYLSLAD